MPHQTYQRLNSPPIPNEALYSKVFGIHTVGTALFSACADAASVVTVLPTAYELAATRRGAPQRADLSVRDNIMIWVMGDRRKYGEGVKDGGRRGDQLWRVKKWLG